MTEPLRPTPPVRIEPPAPARRVDRSLEHEHKDGGRQQQEQRPDEDADPSDEGDGGLHVDLLA